MIPGPIAVRCTYAALSSRIDELRRRGGTGAKLAGRLRDLASLETQLRVLRGLLAERAHLQPVSAEALGWLAAWAMGLPDARAELCLHLRYTQDRRALALERLESADPTVRTSDLVGEACRLLVGPAADDA